MAMVKRGLDLNFPLESNYSDKNLRSNDNNFKKGKMNKHENMSEI